MPECADSGCDSMHLSLLQAPRGALVPRAGDEDEWETDYTVAPIENFGCSCHPPAMPYVRCRTVSTETNESTM